MNMTTSQVATKKTLTQTRPRFHEFKDGKLIAFSKVSYYGELLGNGSIMVYADSLDGEKCRFHSALKLNEGIIYGMLSGNLIPHPSACRCLDVDSLGDWNSPYRGYYEDAKAAFARRKKELCVQTYANRLGD